MLASSEVSDRLLCICVRKDLMDDTDSGVSFNGKANKDSHTGEISFDEIAGSVKRIDPNDSILSAEGFEVF